MINGTAPDTVGGPLAALSLIVAPAILTNASSVLAMSTSNRLARAVDRARELTRQLEGAGDATGALEIDRLHSLTVTEDRALLLMRALRSFYSALGGFASATLLALIGAVAARATTGGTPVRALEFVALGAGVYGVASLVHGSVLLLRETRLAVALLRERADRVRARQAKRTGRRP